MIVFGIGGGDIKPENGKTGFLFFLRRWSGIATSPGSQPSSSGAPSRTVTALAQGGEGVSLEENVEYELKISVNGSILRGAVNEVDVLTYRLPVPALPGKQVGLICGSHGDIEFDSFEVQTRQPKAFIVMQFDTPELDSLYREVFDPICREFDVLPYRADSTYGPGIVISDIKAQITESRLIIAEITPKNPNVYYEVGYADALNKPIILLADTKEGLTPFDVRAYRTIFYENTIGGKPKVEAALRNYLQSILQG